LSEAFAEAVARLERAWDAPDGVLYRLRQGVHDPAGIDDLVALLGSLSAGEDTCFPRRFVSLTWMLPAFMEWQTERVAERGGDAEAVQRDATRVRNALDALLGVP
jgi:hypothetical protein